MPHTPDRPDHREGEFADVFARKARTPLRGFLPGRRVWNAIGGSAAAVLVIAGTAAAVSRIEWGGGAEKVTTAAGRKHAIGKPVPSGDRARQPSPDGSPRSQDRDTSPEVVYLPAPGSESKTDPSRTDTPQKEKQGSSSPTGDAQQAPTGSDGVILPTNTTSSLQSVNYPALYVVVRSDNLGYVDQITSSTTTAVKQSATFTVVPGLADAKCYSFRDSAGRYLHHWDSRVRFAADNGEEMFEKDATYCTRPGSATGSVRLESYNYPGRYLRHYNYELRLDLNESTDTFRADSSFSVVTPWG
jgi:hypothetical protein